MVLLGSGSVYFPFTFFVSISLSALLKQNLQCMCTIPTVQCNTVLHLEMQLNALMNRNIGASIELATPSVAEFLGTAYLRQLFLATESNPAAGCGGGALPALRYIVYYYAAQISVRSMKPGVRFHEAP